MKMKIEMMKTCLVIELDDIMKVFQIKQKKIKERKEKTRLRLRVRVRVRVFFSRARKQTALPTLQCQDVGGRCAGTLVHRPPTEVHKYPYGALGTTTSQHSISGMQAVATTNVLLNTRIGRQTHGNSHKHSQYRTRDMVGQGQTQCCITLVRNLNQTWNLVPFSDISLTTSQLPRKHDTPIVCSTRSPTQFAPKTL